MHIMEGFLPLQWCLFWFAVSAPFIANGIYQLNRLVRENRNALPLLAVCGAFIFVLSSLKMPSVNGSCSHPTGTGLSAIMFGPFITSILSIIVLTYQALFLAHGGLTTLGANVFSMGICGPLLGYWVYRGGKAINLNTIVNVFLASALADIFTYVITSVQLSLAFPAAAGGYMTSFFMFSGIFALTQVPLAIIEGIFLALTFKYINQVRPDILITLGVISPAQSDKMKEAFS
ncbi:energy-coupling factor ABC transporter permease [Methanosphaerula subterraneus]|uniref:energy-coupling factor ABC transporter permease n=1 Tax=Methanosphaerula subterraneus TaxID=3350244 RepID=UPI003F845CDC